MLHTETVRLELPHLIPPCRDRNGTENYELKKLKKLKPHKRQYEKRKAAGLCTSTGCTKEPDVGHTHCRKHLREMSKRNKEQYQQRMRDGLCIYCGLRPQFWGVRCVICRQKWAKDPLPFGARRALRLYREVEHEREREQIEVEARRAVRKLLASGNIKGKRAEALRLYAGLDSGQWRTCIEVAKVMNTSKQNVHHLLLPPKLTLARFLGDHVPWNFKVKE